MNIVNTYVCMKMYENFELSLLENMIHKLHMLNNAVDKNRQVSNRYVSTYVHMYV